MMEKNAKQRLAILEHEVRTLKEADKILMIHALSKYQGRQDSEWYREERRKAEWLAQHTADLEIEIKNIRESLAADCSVYNEIILPFLENRTSLGHEDFVAAQNHFQQCEKCWKKFLSAVTPNVLQT